MGAMLNTDHRAFDIMSGSSPQFHIPLISYPLITFGFKIIELSLTQFNMYLELQPQPP